MKGACPVENSPDWVAVKGVLGEDNTWKLWMASREGVLPEPVKAAFYLYTEHDSQSAAELMQTYIPSQTRAKFDYSTHVTDMIEQASDEMFKQEIFKQWLAKQGYLEKLFQDEKITRTPEKQVEVDTREQTIQELASESPQDYSLDSKIDVQEVYNKILINDILTDYANSLKMKSTTITYEEAKTLLAGTLYPYNGESVFWHKDVNYYVQDRININTQFHEIALPVIQTLRKKNRAEYDKIYNSLITTPMGDKLVEEVEKANPKLNPISDLFKDKVLSAALKQDAINKSVNKAGVVNADPVSEVSNEILINLINDLKGVIRQSFPISKTSSLSKLDSNTSVINLAKTIMEKHLQAEEVTEHDIKEVVTQSDKLVKDIVDSVKEDKQKQEMDELMNKFVDTLVTQLEETKSKEYWEIKKVISDEEAGGYLRDMRDRLKSFGRKLTPEQEDVLAKMDLSFKARSLVESLFTLEKTMIKINEFMDNLKSSGKTTEEILSNVKYYNHLLEEWSEFINSAESHLINAGIDYSTPLYQFVSGLRGLIDKGRASYTIAQEKGAVELHTNWLKEAAAPILESIDNEIARLRKTSGDNFYRDRRIKDQLDKKEKFTFTKEKVSRMYKGELGDANLFSSMFESYTTNPDPILASFALFLKKNLSKITNNYLDKSRVFIDEIRPIMARLGMDQNDVKKAWSQFIVTDNKVTRDANGRVTAQAVLAFMAPVMNYRVSMAELNEAIQDAKETGDRDKIKQAYKNKEDEELLFNRKYKPEYYTARKNLLENHPEAYEAIDDINQKIRAIEQESYDSVEFFENHDALTVLHEEKARLYSEYNEDGTPKDEAGRKIAAALNEHRKLTSKFYTTIPKTGSFQRAFDGFVNAALASPKYAYINKRNDDGTFTPEFNEIVQKWLDQNTFKRYTEEYYIEMADIMNQLEALSKDIPAEYNVGELFKKKAQILSIFKEDGIVNPARMKDKRDDVLSEIKSLQKQISDVQDKMKKDNLKVSPILKNQINSVLSLLSQLRYREPTKYYMDELNEYLSDLNEPELDKDGAIDLLRDKVRVDDLKEKSPKFKEWFNKNHITKSYVSFQGEISYTFQRLDAWSEVRPIETEETKGKYIITTTVDYNGQKYTVEGSPNNKYSFLTVKDEYRTIPKGISQEERDGYVGTVIDNQGRYLPLNKEQFAEASLPVNPKYINEEYYNTVSNKDKRDLLAAIKKFHLANQHGLARDQKLYMDVPRFAMTHNLELAKSGRYPQRWVDRIKSIYAGTRASMRGLSREDVNKASQQAIDDVGEFSNPEVEKEYESLMMAKDGVIDPVSDKIPMRGLNNIPIEDVSYDVLASINMYGLQAEKQRVLSEVAPVANAMLNTLERLDTGTKGLAGVREKMARAGNFLKMGNSNKVESTRTKAFRALYNRELKGQLYSDNSLDWVNKVTAALTKGASINYFALNIPSAIKNYWGMLWQMNIEALAGEYFDFKSMGKAKVRSKRALHEWSTRIWGGDYNTIDTQMILKFDPVQGKAEESTSRDSSRTFKKDVASLSFIYSPRKYMEMEGGLQLFYAMMYHHKLERDINGQKSLVSYADAFELKDGKLTLKEGIDKSWDIGGDNFHKFQNAVHEKFKDLNGVFNKFEKPQAQGWFAYRLFMFMRSYFTTMFMHRFGKERANFALGTVRSGYYRETVKFWGKVLMSAGRELAVMSPSEKRATFKTLADVAQILIISAVASLLFGYDDDDDERYAKLRDKSGALGSEDFEMFGWMSNHTLTLLLKTQSENQSLIPLPYLGLNTYKDLTTVTSVAFGPTLTSYAKILTDLVGHAMPGEDESLYYKRDTGPYPWQKEEEAKVWNHFFSMLGFSGSQVDPVKGLESFETFARK